MTDEWERGGAQHLAGTKVLECAAAERAARDALDRAILDARAAGVSWRQLEAIAELPHTTIRRRARKAQAHD